MVPSSPSAGELSQPSHLPLAQSVCGVECQSTLPPSSKCQKWGRSSCSAPVLTKMDLSLTTVGVDSCAEIHGSGSCVAQCFEPSARSSAQNKPSPPSW